MGVAIGIVLAITVLWWALRFLPAGAEGHLPLPYLIALIPFLWIPALILAVAAIAVGDWWLAGIAAVLAIVVLLRVPLYRLHHHRETARGTLRETARETDRTLTVMTLNCRYGRADARTIADAVRDRHVDILALQELTQGLVTALDDAGIRETLPHRQLGEDRPTDNGGFNGLWTRLTPVSSESSSVEIPAADVPMVVATPAADATVAFASAHTKSPMRGCRAWSQGIIGLGRLVRRHQSAAAPGDAVVVLGDLNCGIDHPSFRRLLASGFRDASMSATRKPSVSFPSWLVWPRIELDHVLLSGDITAGRIETFIVPGTDHLATVATLRMP